MRQRLLHGRALYLVLGAFLALLYVQAMRRGELAPHRAPAAAQEAQPLEWWPQHLDAVALSQLMAREPSLAFALSLLTLVMTGMGASGIALTCWGLWSGRIRAVWRFPSQPLPPWSFGELARITLLTVMLAGLMPFLHQAITFWWQWWKADTHLWITTSMVLLDGFVIVAILSFASEKGMSAKALFKPADGRARASIAIGLRGYLAAFPWIFLLLVAVVEAARRLGFQPPVEPIQELIFEEKRPVILWLTMALACVVGPIAEELFFRGVLYPAIRRRSSRLIAMLVSGAVFSFVHTNLLGFLPIMALGCLLANLYDRTGSLLAPLAVHMLHNTLLLSLALVFRWISGT